MNTEAPTEATAEKARTEAEARRQRILEKSNERMGIISGVKDDEDDKQDEVTARAHKMQALKRRRFKAAAAAKEAREQKEKADTASTVSQPELETTTDEPTLTGKNDTPKEEPASVDKKDSDIDGSEKKYKGVAKMRRQMIKKKQQQKEETSGKSSSAVASKMPIAMASPPVNRLPIVLHLLTTILLFVAGLDVAWNQGVEIDVAVHRDLAPRQHGPGILNRNAAFSNSDTPLLLFSEQTEQREWSDTAHDDEFASTDTSKSDYIPILDPLFGVDLDEVTNGDDFLHIVARGAVYVHRLVLRLFYYLPISILSALLHIPKRLVATPPILCLVSLALRQGSKLFLGAHIPAPSEGSGKSKDVLAMIKNTVLGFVNSSFPTAVALYETFNHVRSDMYVILCGVFMGLALMHHGSMFEESILGEEEALLTTGDEL